MTLLGPWKLGQTHLVCKFCWQNSYAKLENAECDYKSQLRNIYWELSPAVFPFLRDRWHTDARLQITYCLRATGTGFSFVCFALWFLCFVGFFFFPNLFFSLTNFLGLFQALLPALQLQCPIPGKVFLFTAVELHSAQCLDVPHSSLPDFCRSWLSKNLGLRPTYSNSKQFQVIQRWVWGILNDQKGICSF